MDRDVFRWQMSAELHKRAVDAVREDIIEAHENQEPVPIALIFFLFFRLDLYQI